MGFYWILWASLTQLYYSSSLGFMGLPSTSYFLFFHYFGPATAHSQFSTSYTAHGLLFLSFRAPLSPFISSRPIFLSHGLVIHYSCRLGLMGFLSVCQLLSSVAGLLLPTWASKMALNKLFFKHKNNFKNFKTSKHEWWKSLPKTNIKTKNLFDLITILAGSRVPFVFL